MQKLTPYQQSLLDRQRRYLPRATQRRIAQAKLFVAALPPIPRTPMLDLLSGVQRRALMRPPLAVRGYITATHIGRECMVALMKAIDRHGA